MHIVGQIIDKNLHLRDGCQTGIWINPDRDDNWRGALHHCDKLKLHCQDYGSYLSLKLSGAAVEFTAFPEPGAESCQWVILNLPRQKALLRMLLDCASTLLSDNGLLWLAGENKAGIKSADKILKQYFGQVRKLDNARHCTLFEARERLGGSKFNIDSYRQNWRLNCAATDLSITSYPGVFAHGRLDGGTALLLESLSKLQLEGQILDFACGAGVVGAYISTSQAHTEVTLLDNNALALKASEETLASNKLVGSVLASDGLSDVNETYDFVISNPPIHAGRITENLLSQKLLTNIHDHIRPGGALVMVSNLHLPYENWLLQRFRQCKILAENTQFKVLFATK